MTEKIAQPLRPQTNDTSIQRNRIVLLGTKVGTSWLCPFLVLAIAFLLMFRTMQLDPAYSRYNKASILCLHYVPCDIYHFADISYQVSLTGASHMFLSCSIKALRRECGTIFTLPVSKHCDISGAGEGSSVPRSGEDTCQSLLQPFDDFIIKTDLNAC